MIIPMLLSVFVHAVHSVVYTTTFISVSVSAVKLNVMSSQSASVAALFTMVIFLVIRHNFRRALKVFAEHSVGSLALMEKTTLVHSTSMHELPLVQSPTSCIRNDEVKDVRVLTYNFFCRPPFVSNNGEDFKNERLKMFCDEIDEYDVVCLQEMFELMNSRQGELIAAARKKGFYYFLRGNWPSFYHTKFIDSGLLILSRYPIESHDYHMFKHGALVDKFAAKQILYAGIRVSPTKKVHVFTSHTQATYAHHGNGAPSSGNIFYDFGQEVLGIGSKAVGGTSIVELCDSARLGQFREMRSFIDRILDHGNVLGPNDAAMLVGDLNTDALNSTEEYNDMVSILGAGAQYTVSNVMLDSTGKHPVTFGDVCAGTGAPREVTLTAKSDFGVRMCLDYVFSFSSKQKEGLKVHSGEVQPFFVDGKKKMNIPVTQLSDHYGLSAVVSCR